MEERERQAASLSAKNIIAFAYVTDASVRGCPYVSQFQEAEPLVRR
jgi:hypothetical protein